MLYPKLANIKKSKAIINLINIINSIFCFLVLIINYLFSKKLNWSIVAVVSIIYVWRNIFLILKKNKNLASYTFLQMIYTSIIIYITDICFGNKGWALTIGIPIVIITANFAMMVITLIKYKKYVKYALYEIMIIILSIIYNLVLCFISKNVSILNGVAFWLSLVNLAFVLSLNFRTIILEFQKKFHI